MQLRPLLSLALLLTLPGLCQAKTGRTYYTPERLACMADNLARYDWAAAERDKILRSAAQWVGYEDEIIAGLVPPLDVPRCGTVHAEGCPIHGQEILKHPGGSKSWKMSFDRPYQIQCPVGGEWYPSNDFAAYLAGGCRDKASLTGEYVDDGWGCKLPQHEKKYWFVGYYAGEMSRRWLLPAIRDLSKAYLLTGEARYAHKAAVLLWKLSEVYPDYAYEKQSRYGLEFQPWYNGRLQYHTWECFTIQDVSLAYDAIYPAIEGDAELQRFAGKDARQVRRDIEERLLRVAARDITDGSHRIAGNYGMHQSALLRIALVLDTDEGEPTSREMVDWVMRGPAEVTLYTDTPLPDALVNLFHRDGVPFESPSYNCGWMTELGDVAALLALNGVDVWKEPRFRGLYLWGLGMMVCGNMTQPMGDSNNMFAGALGVTPTYLQTAYRYMQDPRLAQAMVQSGQPLATDLFEPPLEEQIRKAAAEYGRPVGVDSELLPGLGYATLQTGTPDSRFALALFYGYYTAHAHIDRLNLELYGHGHPLLPDLGYPETADTYDPRRSGWLEHTAVHNTVMVDATKQSLGFGEPVTYHREGWAQLVEARAPSAYPETVSDYRRASFLIQADDENAYCVDLFRVVGGKQHDWIIHGTEGDFTVEGVTLPEARTQGTLAGPEVPYGKFYDDPNLIEGKPGTRYHLYMGSAYQWLFNVQEAPLTRPASVTWRLTRDPTLYPKKPTEGIGLRVHVPATDETLIVCDGIPQRRPDFPEQLKWVLRRRTGENLQSTFLSVFEPFSGGAPFIHSVERLPVGPDDGSAAVQVELGGQVHVVFWTPQPAVAHRFSGYEVLGRAACIKLDRQGSVLTARLLDGGSLTGPGLQLRGPGSVSARIAGLDYEASAVTLDADVLTQDMAGRWVTVNTGAHVTAVRIDKLLSPRRFSLGEQDLRCGVGSVTEIAAGGVVKHDRVTYFCAPGMRVLDEAGHVVATLATAGHTDFSTTREGLGMEAFPDSDGDGRRRFTIVAIGEGDEVCIPEATDL